MEPEGTLIGRLLVCQLAKPFQLLSVPPEVRKMIYTTNAVEALHRQFRKVTKTKDAFPTDDALKKMLYLATLDMKGALRSKHGWPQIIGQLKLVFGDRIPEHAD
jgi:transposase-like protein